MPVVIEKGVSLAQLNKQNTIKNEEEDVGFFESALAGVATGLWNIPKGFVSLGAELYDLVGDTDTAKDVEKWFDDINPWDDEAEARTVGKITQAITQIAPIAITGWTMGARAGQALSRKLARKAIAASLISLPACLFLASILPSPSIVGPAALPIAPVKSPPG